MAGTDDMEAASLRHALRTNERRLATEQMSDAERARVEGFVAEQAAELAQVEGEG